GPCIDSACLSKIVRREILPRPCSPFIEHQRPCMRRPAERSVDTGEVAGAHLLVGEPTAQRQLSTNRQRTRTLKPRDREQLPSAGPQRVLDAHLASDHRGTLTAARPDSARRLSLPNEHHYQGQRTRASASCP